MRKLSHDFVKTFENLIFFFSSPFSDSMLPNGHKTKEMETAVSVAWLLASLHLPDYPHLPIMELIISFWKYKPQSRRLSSPNCSACHRANGSLATQLFLLTSSFPLLASHLRCHQLIRCLAFSSSRKLFFLIYHQSADVRPLFQRKSTLYCYTVTKRIFHTKDPDPRTLEQFCSAFLKFRRAKCLKIPHSLGSFHIRPDFFILWIHPPISPTGPLSH